MVVRGPATALLLVLALAGCSDSDPLGAPVRTAPEEEGTSPVSWDASGTLTGDDACGLNGVFRPRDDCADASALGLPCTEWDASLTGPDRQPGFAVSARKVCAKGKVQRVVDGPDGMPAYSAMWGAKVVLELAEPLDATACGARGFRLDLEGSGELFDLRVRVRSGANPSPLHFVTVPLPARDFELVFDALDDGQDETRPVSPEAIHSLELEVYSNATREKPFDFCLTDLRLLLDAAP